MLCYCSSFTNEVKKGKTAFQRTQTSDTNVELSLLSDIRDPLIRSFASRRSENAFFAFKKYVEQTEDNELQAKVTIVEKYRKRIPELVSRLKACSENDLCNAGTHTHTALSTKKPGKIINNVTSVTKKNLKFFF